MIPGVPACRNLPLLYPPLRAVREHQQRPLLADEAGDPAYWTSYDHFMVERDRRIHRRRAARAATQAWLVAGWRRLAALGASRSGRPLILFHRGL